MKWISVKQYINMLENMYRNGIYIDEKQIDSILGKKRGGISESIGASITYYKFTFGIIYLLE